MENEFEGLEAPKLLRHKLCGADIFYYFGDEVDAAILKNWNDIATLDGSSITPKDIIECSNCGVRIKTSDLEVVKHTKPNFSAGEQTITAAYVMNSDYAGLERRMQMLQQSQMFVDMQKRLSPAQQDYIQKTMQQAMDKLVQDAFNRDHRIFPSGINNDITGIRQNKPE